MKLHTRIMQPADRKFVISSWSSALRRSPWGGMVSAENWEKTMPAELEVILARPRVHVLVLADENVTDAVGDLIGYLVFDISAATPLIYFCYVKQGYREKGFARRLFRDATIDFNGKFNYVCKTYIINELMEAGKLRRATWRPLLGRFPTQEKP